MKTVISGDIKIYFPTAETVKWILDNLVFDNPIYVMLKRRNKDFLIAKKHIPAKVNAFTVKANCYIVPFGCMLAMKDLLSKGEIEVDLVRSESDTAFKNMPCAVSLRDEQKRAVNALIASKGGLLKAGCGSGKTIIGIELLRKIGRRFLWLCGKIDLLKQTMARFKEFYPDLDVGYITDGEVKMGRDGTIATVQTMINVDYRLYENEFGAVIVDECHNICDDPQTRRMYSTVLARCKARFKYGLTATPHRSDGLTRLIYAYVGVAANGKFVPAHIIKDSETQSLRASYRTFDLNTKDEIEEYAESDGVVDYVKLINYLCSNDERTIEICKEIKKVQESEGRKIAVLSLRVEHCERMHEILTEMGVNSVLVTGKSNKKHRESALGNADSWDVLISTVALFKEGLDIKSLDTVFLTLPIKDRIGIQQSEGRAERPLEGKNDPIYIFAYDKNIYFCQRAEEKISRILNRRR